MGDIAIVLFLGMMVTIGWKLQFNKKNVLGWMVAGGVVSVLALGAWLNGYKESSIPETAFEFFIVFVLGVLILTILAIIKKNVVAPILIRTLIFSFIVATMLLAVIPPLDIGQMVVSIIFMGVMGLIPAIILRGLYKKYCGNKANIPDTIQAPIYTNEIQVENVSTSIEKKNKRIVLITTMTVCGVLLGGCIFIFNLASDTTTNVRMYRGTPAWKLALAVRDEDTIAIEKIVAKKPKLLNYQEPKKGTTLLLWAVGMEKYESAETLLRCGADPNIATKDYKETPLFTAAGYSWVDNAAKKDPKYIRLLINYGADVNSVTLDEGTYNSVHGPSSTPLMNSIASGFEKTKALVEAGADINYKNESQSTAAIEALLWENYPEYAHYLIAEKKAKVTDPYISVFDYVEDGPKEEQFAVEWLRSWIFDLDSKEYKMKMEIVEEFARQGVDYWETPIHESTLDTIKIRYPDTWEEYVKMY